MSATDASQSVQSESAVIGALMLDNRAFDAISDRLKHSHFSAASLGDIYTEIAKQLSAGQSCDLLTLHDALGDKVPLTLLNSLAQYVPSAAQIKRHTDIVISRAKGRALMLAGLKINALAQDYTTDIDDRLEIAQQYLSVLTDDAPGDEFVSAYDGMILHVDVLERRAEGKEVAWPTGLTDLDDRLNGGLRPGTLTVIGARPSMGKTALGLTIALHQAADISVGFMSMEMSHSDIRDRMTAMLGNVALGSVQRPAHGKGINWHGVMEGVERAKTLRFHASDSSALTLQQVRVKARNLKRTTGLSVLVIDYIGLMAGTDKKQSRSYQLEEISKGLKDLAKELGIAVVCLAQLNRGIEARVDATPALSDLRDSGAIEQDADVIVFVHRPIRQNADLGSEWLNYAKLTIAKNRQGPCGVINAHYAGDRTLFSDWHGDAPVVHKRGGEGSL